MSAQWALFVGVLLGLFAAATVVLVTLMNFIGQDMDRFMRYLDGAETK